MRPDPTEDEIAELLANADPQLASLYEALLTAYENCYYTREQIDQLGDRLEALCQTHPLTLGDADWWSRGLSRHLSAAAYTTTYGPLHRKGTPG